MHACTSSGHAHAACMCDARAHDDDDFALPTVAVRMHSMHALLAHHELDPCFVSPLHMQHIIAHADDDAHNVDHAHVSTMRCCC